MRILKKEKEGNDKAAEEQYMKALFLAELSDDRKAMSHALSNLALVLPEETERVEAKKRAESILRFAGANVV